MIGDYEEGKILFGRSTLGDTTFRLVKGDPDGPGVFVFGYPAFRVPG